MFASKQPTPSRPSEPLTYFGGLRSNRWVSILQLRDALESIGIKNTLGSMYTSVTGQWSAFVFGNSAIFQRSENGKTVRSGITPLTCTAAMCAITEEGYFSYVSENGILRGFRLDRHCEPLPQTQHSGKNKTIKSLVTHLSECGRYACDEEQRVYELKNHKYKFTGIVAPDVIHHMWTDYPTNNPLERGILRVLADNKLVSYNGTETCVYEAKSGLVCRGPFILRDLSGVEYRLDPHSMCPMKLETVEVKVPFPFQPTPAVPRPESPEESEEELSVNSLIDLCVTRVVGHPNPTEEEREEAYKTMIKNAEYYEQHKTPRRVFPPRSPPRVPEWKSPAPSPPTSPPRVPRWKSPVPSPRTSPRPIRFNSPPRDSTPEHSNSEELIQDSSSDC